jgi:hypothetical protein
MKVELLVNLKVASGSVISAGTIYTDEQGPIPEFILRRLRRGTARTLPEKAVPPSSISKPVQVGKKAPLPFVKEVKKDAVPVPPGKSVPTVVKKVLVKKDVSKK